MGISPANPLESTLFAPAAATLGSLLGAVFAVLCLVERHHLGELWRRTLFQRWLTWLVIGPLWLAATLGSSLALLALVSAFVLQGLREYAGLTGLPRAHRFLLLGTGLLAGPVALVSREAFLGLPPLLLLAGTLVPLLSQDARSGMRHLAFAALGWAYLPWLLGHLLLLHAYIDGGPGLVLALGPAVALSDVGAFTVGKLLGRHRLAPVLSPHKTWEGVAGNLLGAYAGLGLMHFALPDASRGWLLVTLPPVVALGAIWGDLLESLLKREFGVKDTGSWLPGFGGLLDRIDSLIVVAPLAYYYLRLVVR
jgi:phosphatidate cytidylyltransferase